jgi:hypothetical protein
VSEVRAVVIDGFGDSPHLGRHFSVEQLLS